jgi:predicted amidohydrolase
MKIGFFQFRPVFGDVERNTRHVLERLENVEADLLVLPELALSGYLFASRQEARTIARLVASSGAIEALVDLCRRRRLHLVVGLPELARDRCFNSALLLGPGGELLRYRKLHLFNREPEWFHPGDLEPALQTVGDARVGVLICFDWAFPEITRVLTLRGMDLLCHPSNLVLDHCQRAMYARSVENGIYTVTANRYGVDRRPDGRVRFTGRSQVLGPRGEQLARARAQREELVLVDVDPTTARDKRLRSGNDLMAERRPEFYGPLVTTSASRPG